VIDFPFSRTARSGLVKTVGAPKRSEKQTRRREYLIFLAQHYQSKTEMLARRRLLSRAIAIKQLGAVRSSYVKDCQVSKWEESRTRQSIYILLNGSVRSRRPTHKKP
jgi:hypothetical protein